jgi:ABC-type transporter Mla MlaB component
MSEPLPIKLSERMGITQAKRLHPELLNALGSGLPIVIDGSLVQQIDGASLQLLVSLWRTAADQGIVCRWVGASKWLTHAAGLIGVAHVLQLAE